MPSGKTATNLRQKSHISDISDDFNPIVPFDIVTDHIVAEQSIDLFVSADVVNFVTTVTVTAVTKNFSNRSKRLLNVGYRDNFRIFAYWRTDCS